MTLCQLHTLFPIKIEKRWNHLNAVTVRVKKICKLLNKPFGHQGIAQLGHLVLSSWTLFRPFLIFDIKYLVWMWNDFYFGNVAQQAHHVPQKVGFLRETLFALEIMLRLESCLQKQRFGWLSLKVKSLPWEKGTCPHHRGIFSSFQESRQWGSTRSTRSSPSLCRRCPPWGKNLGWSGLWVDDKTLDTLSFWTTIVSRFWTTSSLPISCFWARSS